MKTKHTQGPWLSSLDRENGLFLLSSAKNEMIGMAVGQNQETDQANANLIAAAPEMYEALKYISEVLECECSKVNPKVCMACTASIVVAKAGGK